MVWVSMTFPNNIACTSLPLHNYCNLLYSTECPITLGYILNDQVGNVTKQGKGADPEDKYTRGCVNCPLAPRVNESH